MRMKTEQLVKLPSHKRNNNETYEFIKDIYNGDRRQIPIGQLRFVSRQLSQIKIMGDLHSQMGTMFTVGLMQRFQRVSAIEKSVLFSENQQAQQFFLILSGAVWVLVDEEKLNIQTKSLFLRSQRNINISPKPKQGNRQGKPYNLFDDSDTMSLSDEYIKNNFPNHKLMEVSGPGTCLGENTLIIGKPTLYHTTCVCKDNTELLVISRDQFIKTYQDHKNTLLYKRAQILSQVSLFDGWQLGYLIDFSINLRVKECHQNSIIYDENTPDDFIYILNDGHIDLHLWAEIHQGTESKKQGQKFRHNNLKTLDVIIQTIGAGEYFSQHKHYVDDSTNSLVIDIKRLKRAVCQSEKSVLFLVEKVKYDEALLRGQTMNKVRKLIIKSPKQSILEIKEQPSKKRIQTEILDNHSMNGTPIMMKSGFKIDSPCEELPAIDTSKRTLTLNNNYRSMEQDQSMTSFKSRIPQLQIQIAEQQFMPKSPLSGSRKIFNPRGNLSPDFELQPMTLSPSSPQSIKQGETFFYNKPMKSNSTQAQAFSIHRSQKNLSTFSKIKVPSGQETSRL